LRAKVTLAVSLFAVPAFAGDVAVDKAWFRALPAHLPAAGYFIIHNAGKSEIVLTGASSAACGMLMLHKSSTASGMASMSDIDRVVVPAGGALAFAPNGFHLMCMDATPALRPGARIPVTLRFANGRSLTTDFLVKNARGQ
jgi:copper(I)-binding protein